MRSRPHRSFALMNVLTALVFGGAPVVHFAVVDHGSGAGDGVLAHAAPCDLAHHAPNPQSASLAPDCPAEHGTEACDAATLLRSGAWLPTRPPLTDDRPVPRDGIRTAPAASVQPTVYRLAPKASPPAFV